jgi:hypothetical protein
MIGLLEKSVIISTRVVKVGFYLAFVVIGKGGITIFIIKGHSLHFHNKRKVYKRKV